MAVIYKWAKYPWHAEISSLVFWLRVMPVSAPCLPFKWSLLYCRPTLSICDIGRNTWTMAMAKYLPILSRGDTEQ